LGVTSGLDAFSPYPRARGCSAMPCRTTDALEAPIPRSSRTQGTYPSGTKARPAKSNNNSVIPGVTFLTSMAPITGAHWFARPDFRLVDSRWASPRQAGFSPYSYRWISDPPKPTFGRPCYRFEGVAPHPNCPPTVVSRRVRDTSRKGRCFIVPSEST